MGLIPGQEQWVKVFSVAVAVAQDIAETQIQSLGRELPHAVNVAI